jgi:dihydropteroate synthase
LRQTSIDEADMPGWRTRDRILIGDDDPIPKIMGIVNITPDSFSDGGRTIIPSELVDRAIELEAQGADLLDLGGESTRPGAEPVSLDEELRRVLPVVEGLVGRVNVPLSIDTTKAEVARRALAAGATVINDISAMRWDDAMAATIAESGAAVALMHMQGTPRTMQLEPRYDDVVSEVYDFLARRIAHAETIGVPRSRIAIDPGIGFGKTIEHNLELLRNLGRFASLGCSLLVGTSRKGFLGTLTGRAVSDRTVGSVVSSLASLQGGAVVVRVHDVGPMLDAIKVWTALRGWGTSA